MAFFRQKYRHVQGFYISESHTAFDLDLDSPRGRNIRYGSRQLITQALAGSNFLIRQKDIWNARDAVDGTDRLPRPSFTAARIRIVERCVLSLVDASLAVDVVVADWLVVDHLSRKDVSKAVVVVFLSRSPTMSRSKFFCFLSKWNFP